jgi:hypothetical protein
MVQDMLGKVIIGISILDTCMNELYIIYRYKHSCLSQDLSLLLVLISNYLLLRKPQRDYTLNVIIITTQASIKHHKQANNFLLE